MASASPRIPRKSRELRQEEVADALLALFGAGGARAVTTQSLADAVGFSNGALFRHFSGLEEVWALAADRAAERLQFSFSAEEHEPLNALQAFARARVGLLTEAPGIARLLRTEEVRALLPEAAQQRLLEIVRRSRAFVLETLERGQEAGEIRDDVAASDLFFPVIGTIHAWVEMRGAAGDASEPNPSDFASALEGLIQILRPPAPSRARGQAGRARS